MHAQSQSVRGVADLLALIAHAGVERRDVGAVATRFDDVREIERLALVEREHDVQLRSRGLRERDRMVECGAGGT